MTITEQQKNNHSLLVQAAFMRAGFPEVFPHVNIEYSDRTYQRIGQASFVTLEGGQRKYTITLSVKHIEADKDGTKMIPVIQHECGHILVWHNWEKIASKPYRAPKPHGKEWKLYAKMCGLTNPTARSDEPLFQEILKQNKRKNKKVRHILTCNCPSKTWQMPMGKAMKTWICQNCKGILQRTGKTVVVF